MTQVKDKTDQQLNQALAELMGWKLVYRIDGNETNEGTEYWETDKGFRQVDFWEPTTCQSDSSEVQAKAIEVDASNFINRLAWIVRDRISGDMEWTNNDIAVLLNASPRERAEAAYITLQGAQQ
ncbi:hypothetical protein NST41_09340 [Paenibacillus sp. FSL L8-0696]|uniref:hypothetical protein n=1 Tax=Paenibacillus sp. FSL L8-0696 TaxID=2954524 RepID=UPI003119E60F